MNSNINTFDGSKLEVKDINRSFLEENYNPELLSMNMSDLGIKNTDTFVGNINPDFNRLLNLIKQSIIPNSLDDGSNNNIIENIKSYMKEKNEPSKIFSMRDKSYTINPLYRKSLSVKINQENTEKIGNLILPYIRDSFFKKTKSNTRIIIHKTHSNLSLYDGESSGFKTHVDKILEFPNSYDDSEYFQMFSLVLCLDSNVDKKTTEGCTIVHLPPYNALKYTIYNSDEYKLDDFKCIPHVFNEGVIPGEFVAFPSNARHSSDPIQSENGFKLILKMDLWIESIQGEYQIETIFRDDLNILSKKKDEPIPMETIRKTFFNCDCMLCNPFRKIIPTLIFNILEDYKILKDNNNKLGFDMAKVITSYLSNTELDLNQFNEYYSHERFNYHQYLPEYLLEIENDTTKLFNAIYGPELESELDVYNHEDPYDDYPDYDENPYICNGDYEEW